MEKWQLDRFSELTAISRRRALTNEEADERHRLRQAYLQAFRQSFKRQLDNTVVEYPDGTRVPLREAGKNNGEEA